MGTLTNSSFQSRADIRFLFSHPAHLLAMGFGSGLSPVAPGTAGTLFGWLIYDLVIVRLPGWGEPVVCLSALVGAFMVGVVACQITGTHLGAPDHGGMVWDEIVAIVLVFSLIPPTLDWQFAGFALFRLFDVRKPPPIRKFERRHKNGFGVMADDVIAAFYTLLVLAVFKIVIEWWAQP